MISISKSNQGTLGVPFWHSKNYEAGILMAFDILRCIMNLFYGPFLALYFFKVSMNSIEPLSLYYIGSYAIVGILPILLGFLLKERHQLATFRLGVILNFVYILYIMIIKEQIIDHHNILALLFGVSVTFYYYPHNLLSGVKVKNHDRDNFELKKKLILTIIGIVMPFLLGAFITATDFYFASVVILLLSAVQIALSFFIRPAKTKGGRYTPVRALSTFLKSKKLRQLFCMDFLRGLTVSDAAIQPITTLLIFNSFQTDLNFGIISSVSNLILGIVSFIYIKNQKCQQNRYLLYICAIIPLLGLICYASFTNNITLIIYYICYNVIFGLFLFLSTIKIYNLANEPRVKAGNLAEYWSLREFTQGAGRVLGYFLLFLAGFLGKTYLYVLLGAFSVLLIPLASLTQRIKK